MKGIRFKKYFSKIGLYDILVFCLVLAFLFFLSFYFREKPTWVKVGIKLSSSNWWSRGTIPPYWLADSIEVGDQEIGAFNKVSAQVEDIQVLETTEEIKDVYLKLKIKANFNKNKQQYSFKGQTISVGSPMELHLGDSFVQGLITFVQQEEGIAEDLIISGKILNVFPWVLEPIEIGDKMKDGQGRVIAEVLEKQVTLADYLSTDWQGNVYIKKRPDRRDAFFKIKVRVSKRGSTYYFRQEQKVKVGEELYIQFENGELDYLSIIAIEK